LGEILINMYKLRIDFAVRLLVASVWIINGAWCKISAQVPRHEAIVARILGNNYAHTLTQLIGIGEVAIGIWIILNKYPKQTALFQMLLILTMNILETILAPDLLLWGYGNIVFAFIFCIFLWYYFVHRLKKY